METSVIKSKLQWLQVYKLPGSNCFPQGTQKKFLKHKINYSHWTTILCFLLVGLSFESDFKLSYRCSANCWPYNPTTVGLRWKLLKIAWNFHIQVYFALYLETSVIKSKLQRLQVHKLPSSNCFPQGTQKKFLKYKINYSHWKMLFCFLLGDIRFKSDFKLSTDVFHIVHPTTVWHMGHRRKLF